MIEVRDRNSGELTAIDTVIVNERKVPDQSSLWPLVVTVADAWAKGEEFRHVMRPTDYVEDERWYHISLRRDITSKDEWFIVNCLGVSGPGEFYKNNALGSTW